MLALIFILAVLGPNYLIVSAKFNQRSTDHYCMIREQRYSYRLDFNKLSREEDYTISHDKGVILRIQPCKQLIKKCNGMEGYSVCLSNHGKEIGVGKEPPIIKQIFGEIIFNYTGDQCDKNKKYTLAIRMLCDLNDRDGNGIELYAHENNECNFNIDWRTQAACPDMKKRINCTVNDQFGNHYDLTQLMNLSNNYEVSISDHFTVILNVCHSILFGKGSCNSNNAACLIDKKSNESKNLGEPVESLKYENDGTLSLNYIKGRICNVDLPESPDHTITTITFICDLDAVGTLPQYVGGMEKCHFYFNWTTASACSEKSLRNKSLQIANTDSCTVYHPKTNQLYNLTSLRNNTLEIYPFGLENEKYHLSICGPLTNTSCKSGSGACKLHHHKSGGIGNSKLLWKENGPYLNYTNGDTCFNKHQKYTIIEFYCSEVFGYELVDEDDLCRNVIKIDTDLVCDKRIKNCATYKNEITFEPLVLQKDNYIINDGSTEFQMNICRSLVKKNSLECPEDAAICKTTVVNGEKKVLNLGVPSEGPILTSSQSAVLIYVNGSICQDDKKKKIESSISFFCDVNSELGKPEYTRYSHCTYYFDWKTKLACGEVDGDFNKNCSITNANGDYRNLSVLFAKEDAVHNVTNGSKNKTYEISLCGNKKYCNGAFVCDNKINYGTKVSVISDYITNLIQLEFTEGSNCNGSPAQSKFTIFCNKKLPKPTPFVVGEEPCYVELEWQTDKICKNNQQKSIVSSTIDVVNKANNALILDESKTLNGIEITAIVILILIILMGIIYLQNASRRSRLLELITNSTSRHCDRVKYSRVNTEEEVQLLLNASDPTVIESDSDDELLDA